MQSIELLLDGDADARVREAWRALAEAGLPSLARYQGASNAPHVTVAVRAGGFGDRVAEAVASVFAGWDLATRGVAAEIGAPLLFGGPERVVLVRQVVPSRRLRTLHEAVHRAIGIAGVEVAGQTATDRWTPHVTLASRLPAASLPDALAAIDLTPIDCRFTAARLWDAQTKTVTPL